MVNTHFLVVWGLILDPKLQPPKNYRKLHFTEISTQFCWAGEVLCVMCTFIYFTLVLLTLIIVILASDAADNSAAAAPCN